MGKKESHSVLKFFCLKDLPKDRVFPFPFPLFSSPSAVCLLPHASYYLLYNNIFFFFCLGYISELLKGLQLDPALLPSQNDRDSWVRLICACRVEEALCRAD